MVSETEEIKPCYKKHLRPLLAEPVTVRLRFRKTGNLQFISHLDLQRTLHRVLIRAGIPVWYTQGFNPHAKIVFSTPLSIGAESICEMVDIRIDREISCEEIKDLLNAEVTEDLKFLDVYYPSSKFNDAIWAKYQIDIYEPGLTSQVADSLNQLAFLDRIDAVKKTKSGEKEINIIPLIRSFTANYDKTDGIIHIDTILNINDDKYLNPDLLLEVFGRKAGLFLAKENERWHRILRVETYLDDGITVFR